MPTLTRSNPEMHQPSDRKKYEIMTDDKSTKTDKTQSLKTTMSIRNMPILNVAKYLIELLF